MKKSFLKNLTGMLLALFCQFAYAQNRTITGTVTSKDDGLPVPGVSVIIKGTRIGTQTYGNGKFSISVPSKGATLVFTFIGFAKTEVPIGSGDVMNVSLANDYKQLNEVVVTGSGVATSKARLGIAVESIS